LLVARVVNAQIVNKLINKNIYYKFDIKIINFYNIWNIKSINTKYTIAKTVRNISIARRIIAQNTIYINRFEIYKNIEYIRVYI